MKKILMKTSMGFDGIASVTMNNCVCLKDQYCYTFLIPNSTNIIRDDYVKLSEENQWKILRISNPISEFFKYIQDVNKELKKGYDIYYINGNSGIMLIDAVIAKIIDKKVKIVLHSHSTGTSNYTMHRILKKLHFLVKTKKIACSSEAGDWAFGKNMKYFVLKNGIDYSKYCYKEYTRQCLKNELKIKNKTVILHVGAFSTIKNQEFIVKIANKLNKLSDDYIWLLVGMGENFDKIQNSINKLNLSKKVILLGNRNDVDKLYSVADIFVLPSIYEGLPVSLIEAQVSGIYSIVSKNISLESCISNKTTFLSIDEENINQWIKKITEIRNTIKAGNYMRDIEQINNIFSVESICKKLISILESEE